MIHMTHGRIRYYIDDDNGLQERIFALVTCRKRLTHSTKRTDDYLALLA